MTRIPRDFDPSTIKTFTKGPKTPMLASMKWLRTGADNNMVHGLMPNLDLTDHHFVVDIRISPLHPYHLHVPFATAKQFQTLIDEIWSLGWGRYARKQPYIWIQTAKEVKDYLALPWTDEPFFNKHTFA